MIRYMCTIWNQGYIQIDLQIEYDDAQRIL